jgi:hypothetical protein
LIQHAKMEDMDWSTKCDGDEMDRYRSYWTPFVKTLSYYKIAMAIYMILCLNYVTTVSLTETILASYASL